jgi:predicted anti-sigma-YlaC factor YlaD
MGNLLRVFVYQREYLLFLAIVGAAVDAQVPWLDDSTPCEARDYYLEYSTYHVLISNISRKVKKNKRIDEIGKDYS